MATKKKSARELILSTAGDRFRKEAVQVPGVDADLYVRELSAKEMQAQVAQIPQSQIEAARRGEEVDEADVSQDGLRSAASFVIATLVNGDNSRVFEAGDEDDLMEALPVGTLINLQKAALRVNQATEPLEEGKNG